MSYRAFLGKLSSTCLMPDELHQNVNQPECVLVGFEAPPG